MYKYVHLYASGLGGQAKTMENLGKQGFRCVMVTDSI
jgi:hypothetical protein